jgi:hypothetical protein
MMAGAPDRGASRRLPPLPLQQPHRDTTYRRTIPRGGDARPAATRPRRLLYVFAGPERPTDGVRAIAAQLGFEVDEVDMLRGGAEHDVLTTATRARLLGAVRGRVYAAILIATPCTSFSVARGNYADGCVHAGLRTFEHPSGPPGASEAAKAFVRKHDALVDFTADLAHAALDLDLELIIENPAPRNDPELASYWPARAHLPQLWDMPRMRELRATGALSLLVVPQCAFGPGPHGKLFQKYTGLLLSHRAAARLADLRRLRCNHHRHDALACGDDATLAAAYPAALNDALVWALTGVRRTAPAAGPSVDGAGRASTCRLRHPHARPVRAARARLRQQRRLQVDESRKRDAQTVQPTHFGR